MLGLGVNTWLYGPVAGGVLVFLLLLWWRLGPGPRRRRACLQARRLLQEGQWQAALTLIRRFQSPQLSPYWRSQLGNLAAECHEAGAQQFLQQARYEDALQQREHAAQESGTDPAEARQSVIEAMLKEVRRLSASPATVTAAHDLISRLLLLSPCPEASFWQTICWLRQGQRDQAQRALARLVEQQQPFPAGGRFIDPLLYLGALLIESQPKEALRRLTEANRIDSNCSLVICQLGVAMVAAGGDTTIAIRALQRALGPRGFQMWERTPERAWIEGLPEKASYLRRLTNHHRYECPLWGADLQPLIRQGQLALAQAHFRQGNFREASEVYEWLIQHGAPSLPVLRGLGLTLVKLQRYDQAFKHLRAAHELEEPKDHLTAGYLALCAARGKPARPEDRVNNVAWSLWLVNQFSAPGDQEWTDLLAQIHADARACGATIPVEQQRHLCEHLLSIEAVTPLAAEAYHHLAATAPEALRLEYAWLFCRAAHEHGVTGPKAVQLFEQTFHEQAQARAFFARHNWSFDDLEYTFLKNAAEASPGRFPAILGPDYSERGVAFLLDRAQQLEQAGDLAGAMSATEILLRLAPHCLAALDRLARLAYNTGDPNRAEVLLEQWHELEPQNPLPLVRRALVEASKGPVQRLPASLEKALHLTRGKQRAAIAFLGARLLLPALLAVPGDNGQAAGVTVVHDLVVLLEDCLRHDPDHIEAAWVLAAVRIVQHDQRAIAALAGTLSSDSIEDPQYQLLSAICQVVAGRQEEAVQACARAAAAPELATEAAYVQAWAALEQGDPIKASALLQSVSAATSPAQASALALLGLLQFRQEQYGEAVRTWQRLEPARRAAWNLDGPLAHAVYLAALQAFHASRFAEAAERLREAGKLGIRDRRLGPLLGLSLFKAGQQALAQATGVREVSS